MAEETKEVALSTPNKERNNLCVFSTFQGFELGKQMARALSTSGLVPDNFKGDQNLGSCMIALDLAARMGINPLQLMQGLYIVHGKPAFSGQFLGGLVNASGLYKSRLKLKQVGVEGQPTFGYRAYAYDWDGDKITGPSVTMQTAAAEGWIARNPKWKSMSDLMLRYRAISFFQRTNCPELTFGIPIREEVEDTVGVVDVPDHEVQEINPDEIPMTEVKDTPNPKVEPEKEDF